MPDVRARAVLNELRCQGMDVLRWVRQTLDRQLGRGVFAHPLDLTTDRVALLFFEDFDPPTRWYWDRHVRRSVRRLGQTAFGRRTASGFQVAFEALVRSLTEAGWRVEVNNWKLAAANPTYPVGIAGYPRVLDHWDLPNPAVLGPGLVDHPAQRADLATDPRVRAFTVPSAWMQTLFGSVYGDRVKVWFAGIDTAQWAPDRSVERNIDVVLYVKLHWDQSEREADLVRPIVAELAARGLRCETLGYGAYTPESYRSLLNRAKAMVFLSEHETQGIAYQQALSMDVPVLAWDQGTWLDPTAKLYPMPDDLVVSSVPYFSDECGVRFRDAAGFASALDTFQERQRANYFAPRDYVINNLSFAKSAECYELLYTGRAQTA